MDTERTIYSFRNLLRFSFTDLMITQNGQPKQLPLFVVNLWMAWHYTNVITGSPAHTVGTQTSNGCWRLSLSVVCNTPFGRNITHQGHHMKAGQPYYVPSG